MTLTGRSCVVCSQPFFPKAAEEWWCSEEHRRALEDLARQNRGEAADLARAVEDEMADAPEEDGLASEAEKARDALLPRPRSRQAQAAVSGESSVLEYLEAAAGLIKAAARLSGAEDAYVLVQLAQGFLGRAAERMEEALGHAAPEPDAEDDPDLRSGPGPAGGPGADAGGQAPARGRGQREDAAPTRR